MYWHYGNVVIDKASRIYNQIEILKVRSVYISKPLTIMCSLYREYRSRDGPLRSDWHTDCFVGIGGCRHYLPETSNVSQQTPDRKYPDTETNVTTELR